jgi:hypothetical protein
MPGLVLVVLLGFVGAARATFAPEKPRLGFPSPPRFEARADHTVEVTWAGATARVLSVVRGGTHTWDRRLVSRRTHVEVHDTIGNPGGEIVGRGTAHPTRYTHRRRRGVGRWPAYR